MKLKMKNTYENTGRDGKMSRPFSLRCRGLKGKCFVLRTDFHFGATPIPVAAQRFEGNLFLLWSVAPVYTQNLCTSVYITEKLGELYIHALL